MEVLNHVGLDHLIRKISDIIGKVREQCVNTINITHSELVSLRDNANLKPGQQYRITDYVTTCTTYEAKSANHQFDIIVTADTPNSLNEEARATKHDGDDYFNNCNLSDWKIWYCIDNDDAKFFWASSNGKGVIYRMIDEHNNDCPYDFKNIIFKGFSILNENNFYYTFNCEDNGTIYDASLNASKENTYTYSYTKANVVTASNNKISSYNESGRYYFPRIVFHSDTYDANNNCVIDNNIFKENCHYNVMLGGCRNNSFGIDCNNNAFERGCSSNVFGDKCCNNLFDAGCNYNSFGINCTDNTFGVNCSGNSFGNDCKYNTFKYNCSNNTFGSNCQNNSFGVEYVHNICNYDFQRNTIGDGCNNNTFGNYCHNNTFGNFCVNNFYGDNCSDNYFDNDCTYNSFEINCKHNTFGRWCSYNSFKNNCYNNSFGNDCNKNSFDINCHNNTFENFCSSNYFLSSCHDNTLYASSRNSFGIECNHNSMSSESNDNSFGNNCDNIYLDTYCSGNSFGANCHNNYFRISPTSETSLTYCCNNHFGNNCCYNVIWGSISDDLNFYNRLQNINVHSGVCGTESNYNFINIDTINAEYEIQVAKNSNGEIKIYCEADLIA